MDPTLPVFSRSTIDSDDSSGITSDPSADELD